MEDWHRPVTVYLRIGRVYRGMSSIGGAKRGCAWRSSAVIQMRGAPRCERKASNPLAKYRIG